MRVAMAHPHRPRPLSAIAALNLCCTLLWVSTTSAQQAGAFNCAAALAKPTVVLFPGPVGPWLGDLTNLMPSHTINTNDTAVALLSLSQPEQAACAKSITDITDTLVIWEDGTLPTVAANLPTGIVRTRPKGQLIIKGKQFPRGADRPTGLTDLNFLSNAQSIGGLSVYNIDGLNTLQGLSKLTEITGDLIISENDNLKNLTGLDALRTVDGDVTLNSNMNIKTLDGLGALQTIGGQLLVKGQGYLMNLDALQSLNRIGKTANFPNNGNVQMRLPGAVQLGNTTVFTEALGSDDKVFVIHSTVKKPAVEDVIFACDTFMPPLSKFDMSAQRMVFQTWEKPVPTKAEGAFSGHIVVFDDGQIPTLKTALSGVTNITGSLLIVGGQAVGAKFDSPGLASLDGLQNIQAVGEFGVIAATQLSDFTGLSSLRAIKRSLVVMFTPNITSFTGLGASAGGLAIIGGEIWLEGNLNLTYLTGLEALTQTGWRVSIIDNPKLLNLDGLRSVRRIGGGLVMFENYALSSLSGLQSLTAVGGGITLMWNTNLTDISGFSRLSKLPGDFSMAGNPITSLEPLRNLSSVGLQFVLAHTNLTDLSGLYALTTVGGGVSITANQQLNSLRGLSALSQIGDDLSIRQNPKLTSLSKLDLVLKTVGGGVYIEDNKQLSSLGSLPETINGIGGLVVVRRNGGIPSSQASALGSKSTRTSSVPDTVALLPGLVAASQQAQAMPLADSLMLTSVQQMFGMAMPGPAASSAGNATAATPATAPPAGSVVMPTAVQAFG